ncbi:MAG: ABC transporter permease [Tissierellaceae bacterium]|nr:ABC transporter permease [Tissierellaceae bacterium]
MSSILLLKLLQLKKDLTVVLLMTALSLGFIFIFAGPTNSVTSYKILVATDEVSPSYNRFMEELRKNKSFNYEEANYETAKAEVEEGKVLAGIYYKDDEISIMKTKDDVNVVILENLTINTLFNIKSSSMIAKEVVGYLNEIKAIDTDVSEKYIYEDLMESIKNRKSMVVSRGFNDNDDVYAFDGFKHITIGMILFMSMYSIIFGIGSILEDKQYNTWNKIVISPLTKADILGGNFVAAFMVGAGQILLLMFLTKYLMGMDWGPSNKFIWVVTIGLLFVMTTTCLGLLLAGVVKTHSQLSSLTPILLTSTSMLGGAMWPLEIVQSKFIRLLANITPQKWAIEAMEQIVIYNGNISDVLPSMGVLLLMSIIFFSIGVRLVKA